MSKDRQRQRQRQKRIRELLLTNQMLLRSLYGHLMSHNSNHDHEPEPVYQCLICHNEFLESERADHAAHCFGYHPDMGADVLALKFERI